MVTTRRRHNATSEYSPRNQQCLSGHPAVTLMLMDEWHAPSMSTVSPLRIIEGTSMVAEVLYSNSKLTHHQVMENHQR